MNNKLYDALEEIVIAENYYNSLYSDLEELENKVRVARNKIETARADFNNLVLKTKADIVNK